MVIGTIKVIDTNSNDITLTIDKGNNSKGISYNQHNISIRSMPYDYQGKFY